jgi:phosphopantetheine adenylyltransferase
VPTAGISTPEVVGLLAAFASIALAVFAIWQATTFYRWSEQAAKEGRDSARELAGSVEQIEKLFDTFYADTFSLMRDTYEDFRKHSWPSRNDGGESINEVVAEKAAEKKIQELRDELLSEVRDARNEIDAEELVERAITGARLVDLEAEREAMRPIVIARIEELRERNQSRISSVKLARPWMRGAGRMGLAFEELFKLREEGSVNFTVDPEPEEGDTPEPQAIFHFEFD